MGCALSPKVKVFESCRQLFLSCISLCYIAAFTSYYVQIPGLFGRNGLLPSYLWVNRGSNKNVYDRFMTNPSVLYLLSGTGLTVEEGLVFLCIAGLAIAIFSFSTRIMRSTWSYFLMWIFYFSLFDAGQTFLSFQWDILLLEAGFLSVLIAPFNFFSGLVVRVKRHDEVLMFLVRFLLFKLMFMSGVVKLQSQCPTWWGLTALTHHYETQCIPTPLAWFAHSLFPFWFHKLSVVAVYVIEIIMPFFFFSPIKSQRTFAIYSTIFLMISIMLTGNYNFFNFLTIALCLGSLEDGDLWKYLHSYELSPQQEKDESERVAKEQQSAADECSPKKSCWLTKWFIRFTTWFINIGLCFWTIKLFNLRIKRDNLWSIDSSITFTPEQFQSFVNIAVVVGLFLPLLTLLWIICKNLFLSLFMEKSGCLTSKLFSFTQTISFSFVALLVFSVSFVPISELSNTNGGEHLVPEFASSLQIRFQHLRISNSYGLFRRMTGVGGRPEIVLEGSDSEDGPWTEYHFMYKPGNVSSKPPWVAPHQPRLDWQMWFAALSTPQFTPWFKTLVFRLLTGQPEVLALLDSSSIQNLFHSRKLKPHRFIRAVKYRYYFTKGYQTKNWWRREKEAKLYLEATSLTSPSMVDHIKQYNVKTSKPLAYSDSWAWFRRVIFKLSPTADILSFPGDALCWSFLLPCVAMKLGKIFTPKYPVEMFYL